MGHTTWARHLTDKIPMAVDADVFGWRLGRDYLQESAGRRGLPSFWLSEAAAFQLYTNYA